MAQEQVAKLKKKQWCNIIAPMQFDNAVIGETLVYEPQQMIGKTLSHSLMNLSNDPKRQNINIHFKIVDIEDGKGKTSIIGYEIVHATVKRFMRRNSEKMDLSFNCETADNVFLRVKPIAIAKGSVKGSVAAKLRHSIISFLTKTIKKMNYNDVINDTITHKIQSAMRESLNKIYPLKVCEIRYIGIEAREQNPAPLPAERDNPEEAAPEVKNSENI